MKKNVNPFHTVIVLGLLLSIVYKVFFKELSASQKQELRDEHVHEYYQTKGGILLLLGYHETAQRFAVTILSLFSERWESMSSFTTNSCALTQMFYSGFPKSMSTTKFTIVWKNGRNWKDIAKYGGNILFYWWLHEGYWSGQPCIEHQSKKNFSFFCLITYDI